MALLWVKCKVHGMRAYSTVLPDGRRVTVQKGVREWKATYPDGPALRTLATSTTLGSLKFMVEEEARR